MNLSAKTVVDAPTAKTSVRYKVLWLCVALYAITYMDRVCINMAAPVIAKEFGFDKVTIGLIFSAFYLGYSLLQVPAGWLADRIGPRRMLTGHRPLVVGIHNVERRCLERHVADGGSIPVWSW